MNFTHEQNLAVTCKISVSKYITSQGHQWRTMTVKWSLHLTNRQFERSRVYLCRKDLCQHFTNIFDHTTVVALKFTDRTQKGSRRQCSKIRQIKIIYTEKLPHVI